VLTRALAGRYNHNRPDAGWSGSGWFEPESRTRGLRYGWDGATGQADPCGLAGHGWRLAAGDELVHRARCDTVDLFYSTSGDGGLLDVTIDTEHVATIDTSDIGPGRVSSGHRWRSDPIPFGWHAIAVRSGGDAPVLVDGGYFHEGTRSSGVQVHVGGHNGWTTADVLDCAGTRDHLRRNQPHLIVWFTGANDYRSGVATYGHELRRVASDMRDLAPDASLVFVCPFAIKLRADWSDFRDTAEAVAAEAGSAFVDIHGRLGDRPASTYPDFLSRDRAHPSDVGHRFMAEAIAECILDAPLLDGDDRAPGVLGIEGDRQR
jgi:lysophospholipase L1-like esterase